MTEAIFEQKVKTAEERWQKNNPDWQIDSMDHSDDERLWHNTIIHFMVGDNRNDLQSVIVSWTGIANGFEDDIAITMTNQHYPGYRMEKPFGQNQFELYNPHDKVTKSEIGIDAALGLLVNGNLA